MPGQLIWTHSQVIEQLARLVGEPRSDGWGALADYDAAHPDPMTSNVVTP